ncbi:MAG TPA: DNA polymerase IV, partial [Candidatus Micrarchaeota archaeon]|nr:DNA polymerase IV [Candidatus Micrarchaeota archaeon]
ASYEARALGVKSGMPIKFAKRIAPSAIYLKANFELYGSVSDSIMSIAKARFKTTEMASIDEIYADVSFEASGDYAIAEKMATELKNEILEQERLTCSIGIGRNKLIAKMASDFQKPGGLTIVRFEETEKFLDPLPVKKLIGIGPKTEEALAKEGITAIGQLKAAQAGRLVEVFGQAKGKWLHDAARGIDDEPVRERDMPVQMSRMATLKSDSQDPSEISRFCSGLFESIKKDAGEAGITFTSLSVIIILANLKIHTKSRKFEHALAGDEPMVQKEISALVAKFFEENPYSVCRRAGVRISGLEKRQGQKSLFDY